QRAIEVLRKVGIPDAETRVKAYPHELSGGMAQRVMIAMALASGPDLLIADEPTTALDVTVQKQILKLIKQMQKRHGTALLFVTHDLGVVSKVCQSLSVLFGGMVLEDTRVEPFFAHPAHPYSAALLAATPKYTDPDASLTPVPDAVIEGVQAEIAAHDRMQPHV
ncbi:MAG: ATP-binding cassette domain-containing protein, partial [Pseudodonghicola sp.]|nr:ATP-binding cassette domain-containing protein [Pseudodonghicola sp.]